MNATECPAEPAHLRAVDVVKSVPMPAAPPLTILHGISLEVQAGETLAVVGASGSGKTTLLGLLAGLDLPTTGHVELLGTSLAGQSEDRRAALRAGRVGFVFQSFQLLASFSALENVMLPLELTGVTSARTEAADILRRVGLASRTGHYPRQLSGGEQQRVALARAFATQPEILFADEPTGNLDTETGSRLMDLLFELNQERGTTLILVTHEERLARRCGRTITLAGGRVASSETALG